MPNRPWLPFAVVSDIAVAVWGLAAAHGYAWEMIWLPAAVAGAAWPAHRRRQRGRCRWDSTARSVVAKPSVAARPGPQVPRVNPVSEPEPPALSSRRNCAY